MELSLPRVAYLQLKWVIQLIRPCLLGPVITKSPLTSVGGCIKKATATFWWKAATTTDQLSSGGREKESPDYHSRRNVTVESLLTSEGSVSSTRMLGPVASGPKAQMDRAARISHSYLVWKNSPSFLRGQEICTASFSMSSARPFSNGSAIIVSLFLCKRPWNLKGKCLWRSSGYYVRYLTSNI